MTPSQDLESLYGLLSELRSRVGGFRQLRDTNGRSGWPRRGVYFFFDEHETRGSGTGLRVVRVGTHALRFGSRTTLWAGSTTTKATKEAGTLVVATTEARFSGSMSEPPC